jgi:hypothetical protein
MDCSPTTPICSPVPTSADPPPDAAAAGFLLGANLPWVRYGCDFGRNAWNAGGLSRRNGRDRVQALLSDLAARGVTAVRWFVFCDGRSGIDFDAAGAPLSLQTPAIDDFSCALELAEAAGVQLVPVLFDFTWCDAPRVINDVCLGGRAAAWRDPALRAKLLDAVVRPFAARFAGHHAVVAWDLMNEPEWVTRGAGTTRLWRSLSVMEMQELLSGFAAILRAEGARTITVGSASARWLWLVKPIGLDVYQPHWYDHLDSDAPLARPLAALDLDRPAWLGELPTRRSRHSPDRIFRIAQEAGYAGVFFWSAMADDDFTDFAAATAALDRWRRA